MAEENKSWKTHKEEKAKEHVSLLETSPYSYRKEFGK